MSSGYRYWLEIPEIVDLEVCSDISLTSRGKKTPFTNKKQVGLFPSRKQLAKEKHLQNSDFGRGELLVSGTSMPYINICIIHLSLSFQGNPEGDLTWTSPDSGVKCSGFNSWWTVFPMAMGQRGTSWLKFTGVVLATWNILVIYIILYIYMLPPVMEVKNGCTVSPKGVTFQCSNSLPCSTFNDYGRKSYLFGFVWNWLGLGNLHHPRYIGNEDTPKGYISWL